MCAFKTNFLLKYDVTVYIEIFQFNNFMFYLID